MLNLATWWALGAAIPAVTLEYLYRTLSGTYASNFVYFIGLQLGVSYCVYQLVRQPETSLVDAFVIWAVCTTSLRIFVSVVILRDDVGNGTWFALALLLLARVAQTAWGK